MHYKFLNFLKNLFFHKIWNIGYIKINKKNFVGLKNLNYVENNFTKLKLKEKNFIFFADPFPLSKKLILAEAMNLKNIGELVLIDTEKNLILKRFTELKGHVSFPFIFFENKSIYIIPEISHWSNQKIFKYDLKNNKLDNEKNLIGENLHRLKDPVVYKKRKNYFLFFNLKNSKKVEVYHSKKLIGKFKKVKNISKGNSGFRMGGNIINLKNKEYRISQNNSNLYGDGVKLNKIIKINNNIYNEKFLRVLKFNNLYGPHTISFTDDYLFFDYYFLKFDLFAFFKKLKTKIFS